MTHTCDAVVITCIDFRFQLFIDYWIRKNVGDVNYDRVALGGGVYDFYAILKQVEISDKLHHIKKVILMNHEDCGAYGAAGIYARHKNDLTQAKKTIEKLYPKLKVETYYVHLDGEFEKISSSHDSKKLIKRK